MSKPKGSMGNRRKRKGATCSHKMRGCFTPVSFTLYILLGPGFHSE